MLRPSGVLVIATPSLSPVFSIMKAPRCSFAATLVDVKRVVALARYDQIAAISAGVVDRETFDVHLEIVAGEGIAAGSNDRVRFGSAFGRVVALEFIVIRDRPVRLAEALHGLEQELAADTHRER